MIGKAYKGKSFSLEHDYLSLEFHALLDIRSMKILKCCGIKLLTYPLDFFYPIVIRDFYATLVRDFTNGLVLRFNILRRVRFISKNVIVEAFRLPIIPLKGSNTTRVRVFGCDYQPQLKGSFNATIGYRVWTKETAARCGHRGCRKMLYLWSHVKA